jgi:hypothetical protein
VNTKKELLATSLLAIALAVGLGTISFGLFSEAPPNVRIDVFSKKNGATSTSFLPSEQVLLEAQVSKNNASIAGAPVTFEVKAPNGTDFLVQTATTDSLGTANVTFQIPWSSIISPENIWQLGTWQTQTTIEIYGQTLNATTNFNCELLQPAIDVYTQKGGYGPNTSGGTFTLSESVILYVEIRNELNHTLGGWPIGLEVKGFEGESLATSLDNIYTPSTNASGVATVTNPIPPISGYTGTYVVYARFRYYDVLLTDTVTFIEQP